MKFRLFTLGALTSLIALTANCQTTVTTAGPAATVAGSAPAAAPVLPVLQQRQAVTSPVPATQVPPLRSSPVQQPGQVEATMQDQAVTQSDQLLLSQLRQLVQNLQAPIQSSNGSWAPIHFDVANGVVTLMGTVENADAKQRIEAVTKRTTGVVSVLNQLKTPAEINSATALSAKSAGQAAAAGSTASQSLTGGAMSPADQTLLLRVRQVVIPQIQVANQPVPVNFTVQQGVVTVVGSVTSLAQKRQIAALVQQVPGVVRVTDRIMVPGVPIKQSPITPAASFASVGSQTNRTAVPVPGPNSVPNPNSVLSPTGRTNGAALLPPALQREDLPPGLDRRSTLPQGLRGTNSQP